MKIVIPEYENKKNHNVWDESTLHFSLKYIWFFFALMITVYILFYGIALWIVHFISIEKEQELFKDISIFEDESVYELPEDLQNRYSHVPYQISITDEIEEANAFATIGARIYITQALLDETESLSSLDFVIGHEVGHIEHRDVLRGIVSEAPIQIFLILFGFNEASVIFTHSISHPHSKYQETRADEYGIDFVHQINEHVWCALEFFESKNSLGDNISEIFSTHPVTHLRIQRIEEYIQEKGYEVSECE